MCLEEGSAKMTPPLEHDRSRGFANNRFGKCQTCGMPLKAGNCTICDHEGDQPSTIFSNFQLDGVIK